MKILFLIILCLCFYGTADVKSTSGQIKFDVENDGQLEMVLDSTGLGVGIEPSEKLHINGNAIISNQLFIGGSNGSSNLNINGTIGFGYQTLTSSTTLDEITTSLVDTSTGNIILGLPEASSYDGQIYTIKKISSLNNLVINGSDLIDGSTEVTLGAENMGSLSIMSNSGNWHILSMSDEGELSIASDNFVANWKMDELTSGNLIDEINIDPTKVLKTSSLANSDPVIGVGKIDGALELDGDNDNVFLDGSDTDLAYIDNATQLSVSLWLKVNDLTSDGVVVSKGNFSVINPILIWRDESAFNSGRTDTLTVVVSDGSNNARIEGTSNLLNDSDWHHMVMTYQGNNAAGLKLYLDGVEDANSSVDTTSVDALDSNSNYFRLGRSDDLKPLNGSIDEVRIFDKVLSESEIQALYLQGQ